LIFLCNFPNMFLSAHTFHIGANTVPSATTQQKNDVFLQATFDSQQQKNTQRIFMWK
jgi:hypothetical protein